MPNRMLRDWTGSEKINLLSVHSERFFIRLIMKVDDYGCFYGDSRLLKANLYPLQMDKIREADLLCWITECVKAGLIVLYENSGKRYLQILDFRQRLDRAKSKYPLPTVNDSPPEVEREVEPEVEGKGNAPAIHYVEKIEKPLDEDRFETYQEWTDLIISGGDQFFEQMLSKEKIEFLKPAVNEHLELVARYNWQFNSQQKFRVSVIKHTKEFIEKKKNGSGGKFQPPATDTVYKSQATKQPDQKESLSEVALEEKNRRARAELKNEIETDVILFSENEFCRLKIPAVKMEILLGEETIEIADEEKRAYFNQAREDRMKELNANYDPATKIILHHYRDGKTPDSELGLLRTMAREIAYRIYLKKRVEENTEKLYSIEPAPENIV